ncbi:MAG TPA: hypothetical protein VH643_19530 [Gemmataceae bacterium]|jgi:hypothetical protein
MITVHCPGCGAALPVDDRLAGCPIHCRHCRHEFTVPESAPVAERAPSPSVSWPEEQVERPRRKPRKGRSVLFTCGIIAAVVVLACGGLGTAFYFVFVHEIEEPVTAADRGMVITSGRLAEFIPALQHDPSRGKLRKVRHLDGNRELTYEYEAEEGEDNSLFIQHQIGVERTAQDAQYAYGGLGIGTNIGLRILGSGKVRQVERNDLWRWGDDSKCILLMNGDNKVGNLFMARKGRRYFTLMIVGVYFENSNAIQQLLGPTLQRLDSYEP